MKVCEMYYKIGEAAFLLRICHKTVLRLIKARELGDQVVNIGSNHRPEYRIPGSGLGAYLERNLVFKTAGLATPKVASCALKTSLNP
jgi:hypothetical protein